MTHFSSKGRPAFPENAHCSLPPRENPVIFSLMGARAKQKSLESLQQRAPTAQGCPCSQIAQLPQAARAPIRGAPSAQGGWIGREAISGPNPAASQQDRQSRQPTTPAKAQGVGRAEHPLRITSNISLQDLAQMALVVNHFSVVLYLAK